MKNVFTFAGKKRVMANKNPVINISMYVDEGVARGIKAWTAINGLKASDGWEKAARAFLESKNFQIPQVESTPVPAEKQEATSA